ncbi:MAG: lysophospholipid acyltransferase family protein [Pseudolabrys sp.]
MARLGLDYPTHWGRSYSARLVRHVYQSCFLVPYSKYMSTLEVRGIENITGPGPFIYAANHTSNLDTPLVLSALPLYQRRRTVVAAAMDNFFMKPYIAFHTVLFYNGIPIDRHRVNRRSAQQALELVEDHWNLLIYPEGGRTTDGDLQEFKGGAAYLADRSKAVVVPTYVHGAGYLRAQKYAKAPKFTAGPQHRRHHVIVTFGPALRADEDENLRRFSTRIENAVIDLGRQVSGDPTYGARVLTSE